MTAVEEKIFNAINLGHENNLFDAVMPVITNKWGLISLVIVLWLTAFYMGNTKIRKTLLVVALLTFFSDMATMAIKYIVQRERPCEALEDIRVLINCSDSFSFPSRHTVDMFAIGIFLSYKYQKMALTLIVLSLVTGYGRIYVGAHYPFDVLIGAMIGIVFAFIFHYIDEKKLHPLIDNLVDKNLFLKKLIIKEN